jgi:predicted amidohydrolase YtcJ
MAARLTAYLVALIVGVTFIAGLIVGAQRGTDGPVDLIVVNGSVYTADGDSSMAEAVAVQGNKILLVGSNRDVQRLRRPQTVVVDAKGGTVLPGFNESVADLVASGLSLQQVDLEDAESLTAIETTLAAWTALNPDAAWVVGHGWSPRAFGDRRPTRQMLDALIPDRPAFLVAADGERAWVNTAALKLAKVTRRSPSPAHGAIEKDPATGEPTGILVDSAMQLVARLLPAPTRAERLTALQAAIDDAHRRGVTSVQDLSTAVSDLDLYDELRRRSDLHVRVYAAVRGDVDMTDEELDALDEVRTRYSDDPLFKAGAMTLVVDDHDEEELRDVVTELDDRGWQVIIQAISEGAVRIARDAVDYASGKNQAPDRGRRHRVELAERTEVAFQSVQLAGNEKRAIGEAVDDVTRDAAWQSFDEHRKGSIERDMLADLVILTSDIFAIPDRPVDFDVAFTIFDGRIVYTRPTESND